MPVFACVLYFRPCRVEEEEEEEEDPSFEMDPIWSIGTDRSVLIEVFQRTGIMSIGMWIFEMADGKVYSSKQKNRQPAFYVLTAVSRPITSLKRCRSYAFPLPNTCALTFSKPLLRIS